MRFGVALGEMKAKSNQPILAGTVIAVKNCAFEQTFLQISADFVLNPLCGRRAEDYPAFCRAA